MTERRYHHLGLVAKEPMEGEYYFEEWKVSLIPYDTSEFHLQWCRYHEGCVFPELIQTVPHVAFIVEDLKKALEGKKILYGPFEPLKNWHVAFIEECGAPGGTYRNKLNANAIKCKDTIKTY